MTTKIIAALLLCAGISVVNQHTCAEPNDLAQTEDKIATPLAEDLLEENQAPEGLPDASSEEKLKDDDAAEKLLKIPGEPLAEAEDVLPEEGA